MSRPTVLMLCVFSVLAVISYFLVSHEPQIGEGVDATLPEGYYMKDATLRTTDESGVTSYQLRARRIDHRPSDGAITLTELTFDYGSDKNQWRVRADSGLMPRSGDRIALIGQVTTTLQSPAAHGATRMTSDTMDVDIANETATTQAPVTVSFDKGQLQAVGLDIDLASESITLRSKVQGTFEPPND